MAEAIVLESAKSTTAPPPVVLVVEDEVLIRMAMAQAMRELGLVVIEARDASEALDIMHAGIVPDALFTDIRMPGSLDGLHLAALLEVSFPDMQVFVSSGHMSRADLRLQLNFIPKPTEPEVVARQISAALSEPWRSA